VRYAALELKYKTDMVRWSQPVPPSVGADRGVRQADGHHQRAGEGRGRARERAAPERRSGMAARAQPRGHRGGPWAGSQRGQGAAGAVRGAGGPVGGATTLRARVRCSAGPRAGPRVPSGVRASRALAERRSVSLWARSVEVSKLDRELELSEMQLKMLRWASAAAGSEAGQVPGRARDAAHCVQTLDQQTEVWGS